MAEYGLGGIEQRPVGSSQQSPTLSAESATAGARQIERFGAALKDASTSAVDISLRLQAQEDAVKVMAAETALKNQYMEFQTQAKERLGGNAWGLHSETTKWFDDKRKEIGPTLTTERQQRMFGAQFDNVRMQGVGWAGNHELSERRKYTEEASRASIVGSINMAAANPYDVEVIGSAKREIVDRVQTVAQLNGWDPKRRDVETATHLGNLHSQVIQNLLASKDPTTANEYYKANVNEIPGSQRDGLLKQLSIGDDLKTAQEFTDAVVAMGVSEADAVAEARKKLSGDAEKLAVTEIKTRYAEDSVRREKAQKDARDEAWKKYSTRWRVSDLPPELITRLDGNDYRAIVDHADARAERALRKSEVDSNRSDGETLHALFQVMPTKQFEDIDLRKYMTKLSRADYRYFEAQQAAMKVKPEKTVEVKLDNDLFNRHAERAGLRPFETTKSESDKASLGRLRAEVEERIAQAQAVAKRALTHDEKSLIVERVVDAKVIREGVIWNSSPTPAATLPPDADRSKLLVPIEFPPGSGAKLNVPLRDIPPDAYKALTRRFIQNNGYAPTVTEVATMWKLENSKRKAPQPGSAAPEAPVPYRPLIRGFERDGR